VRCAQRYKDTGEQRKDDLKKSLHDYPETGCSTM
jgi:hypothetical protein